MKLDPTQYWDQEVIAAAGVWEPGVCSIIKACVKPGDACIDVGAHKGYMTCLFAQVAGPSGRVIAFDPDPRAVEALNENVQQNNFRNAKVFQSALGNSNGTITLFLNRTLGWSSAFPNEIASPGFIHQVDVDCKPLDTILSSDEHLIGNRCLSVIKIDAEGYEPLIWKGMQQTLSKHSPAVIMEINPSLLKTAHFDLSRFKEELICSGYEQILEIKGSRFHEPVLNPIDIAERNFTTEILALRPNSSAAARIREFMQQL